MHQRPQGHPHPMVHPPTDNHKITLIDGNVMFATNLVTDSARYGTKITTFVSENKTFAMSEDLIKAIDKPTKAEIDAAKAKKAAVIKAQTIIKK